MNKKHLFEFLNQQDPVVLLRLLEAAFDTMSTNQRRNVFGTLKFNEKTAKVDEQSLLKEVMRFYDDSLKGAYYAPFEMSSKNYSTIPEETEEWFEKLADLLGDAAKVSEKGSHQLAVECFKILFELIDRMSNGDEIVFADEYGTWMIPGDEKVFIKAYLSSLAAVSTPEGYVEAAIPLVKRDSYESLHNEVYKTAAAAADKEQKKLLDSTVKSLKIRVR